MRVSICDIPYDVIETEDLPPEEEGSFEPVQRRILIRKGARKGTYEHEELHAVLEACGLNLLLECNVLPKEKREELIVSVLTPALRSVKRDNELCKYLAEVESR